MTDVKELLKAGGKVNAPDDFTNKLLIKIDNIIKVNEFVMYLFSSWVKLVYFLLKTINDFFTKKIKSND